MYFQFRLELEILHKYLWRASKTDWLSVGCLMTKKENFQ